MTLLRALMIFSAVSFLFFGLSCLFSKYMVDEFKRYGLANFRLLNGILQVVAACALFLGVWYKPLALVASLGLSLLMFAGFLVRLKIRDGFVKSSPAFLYMVLNAYIFYLLLQVKEVL